MKAEGETHEAAAKLQPIFIFENVASIIG